MTSISQVELSNLSDVHNVFAYDDNSSSKPIVAIGPKSFACCHCCLSVPSGYYVIFSRHGAAWKTPDGMPYKREGLICCWPWWKRVSHVVTQKAIRFNAPVSNCPTHDNVMVSIDVSFNFQIQDPETFVFKLGVGRFQEMLRVETEEVIRTLVYSREVLTLRDSTIEDVHTQQIQAALNRSVNVYGVQITNIRITKVTLPAQLQKDLTEQTELRTQLEKDEKAHRYRLKKMQNERLQQNKQAQLTYEREAAEQEVEVKKELVIRESKIMEIRAAEENMVIQERANAEALLTAGRAEERDALTLAEQKAIEVLNRAVIGAKNSIKKAERDIQQSLIAVRAESDSRVYQAQAQLRTAETTAAKEAIQVVNEARINAERRLTQAQQEKTAAEARARGIMAVGAAKAAAISADMEVETECADSIQKSRNFEIEESRLEVLEQLANNGNMVITGQRAAGVLDFVSFAQGGGNVGGASASSLVGAAKEQ